MSIGSNFGINSAKQSASLLWDHWDTDGMVRNSPCLECEALHVKKLIGSMNNDISCKKKEKKNNDISGFSKKKIKSNQIK